MSSCVSTQNLPLRTALDGQPRYVRRRLGLREQDGVQRPARLALGSVEIRIEHARRRHPRAKKADADGRALQLQVQRLAETDDGMLRRAVRRTVGGRQESRRRRRDQHVRWARARAHAGQERLQAMHDAEDVDIELPTPVGERHFVRGTAVSRRDARVCTQQVDVPETRAGHRCERLHGVGLRDIRGLREQALPGSQANRDLASRLFEGDLVEVGETDRCALCDQLFDQGAADASSRPGHHGDFPVERLECHLCPSARAAVRVTAPLARSTRPWLAVPRIRTAHSGHSGRPRSPPAPTASSRSDR